MLLWKLYNCTMKYRPGKEMLLTNGLSHLHNPTYNTIEMYMHIDCHGLMTDRNKQLKMETTADPTLAVSYDLILNG